MEESSFYRSLRIIWILAVPQRFEICRFLTKNGPKTLTELVIGLGGKWDAGNLWYHLGMLKKGKIIEEEFRKAPYYFILPDGEKILRVLERVFQEFSLIQDAQEEKSKKSPRINPLIGVVITAIITIIAIWAGQHLGLFLLK